MIQSFDTVVITKFMENLVFEHAESQCGIIKVQFTQCSHLAESIIMYVLSFYAYDQFASVIVSEISSSLTHIAVNICTLL